MEAIEDDAGSEPILKLYGAYGYFQRALMSS
jgi:hypothetical protein